jgi:hypothetical protein
MRATSTLFRPQLAYVNSNKEKWDAASSIEQDEQERNLVKVWIGLGRNGRRVRSRPALTGALQGLKPLIRGCYSALSSAMHGDSRYAFSRSYSTYAVVV